VELEDVFRAHQRAVFAYFLRVVGNRQDAEELTQETFVRACGAAVRFRGDAKVSTWLFGIARRVLLEAVRAGLFEQRSEVDEQTPARADDPDERMDLERALASLGAGDREVLVMVDMLGFEPIEVAGILGVSPETFRVRLHRARARLRDAYGR
jgi:RNA polymerase sigma-70 factor (ECF subfamily)